jgi:hypothetical protein
MGYFYFDSKIQAGFFKKLNALVLCNVLIMKLLKWFGVLVLLLIVVYFLGPQPATPVYTTNLPVLPAEANALENYILTNESHTN